MPRSAGSDSLVMECLWAVPSKAVTRAHTPCRAMCAGGPGQAEAGAPVWEHRRGCSRRMALPKCWRERQSYEILTRCVLSAVVRDWLRGWGNGKGLPTSWPWRAWRAASWRKVAVKRVKVGMRLESIHRFFQRKVRNNFFLWGWLESCKSSIQTSRRWCSHIKGYGKKDHFVSL